MDDERRRAARRALVGTALGDSFGQTFLTLIEAPEARLRRRELPPGPWRWSDDTMMAAALTEVLLRHRNVEQDELAGEFARRYAEQPDRGYGAVAHHILTKIHQGQPWQKAARSVYKGEGSMGNGAAMRVAPAGAYFFDDLAQAARAAVASAEVTHAHPEGQAGAVAVAVAAAFRRAQLGKRSEPGALLEAALRYTPPGRVRDGLRAAQRAGGWKPFDVAEVLGDGSEVIAPDTVPYALWIVAHHGASLDGALFAAMEGLLAPSADRDTVCAIVGGAVAAGLDDEALPPSWRARCEPLPAVQGLDA